MVSMWAKEFVCMRVCVCAHNCHAWPFLALRERHALLETAPASI